jgi:uncharacterized iron-regulated membrane protein
VTRIKYAPSTSPGRARTAYRTIWRWHFYAGLFCIPFVLWLSVTGSIYLFKPQIEAWLDRPYEQLATSGIRASAQSQVNAALTAVPGSMLNAYELPATDQSAVRVLVGRGADIVRVYVHPDTTQILKVVSEDDRFMRQIFRLHGELMLGDRGSIIVELAASWAIVMLITGLYLWWPRGSVGLAGIVYPRLRSGGRIFWRDLHAVTGLWVSFLALFLLVSGLPWTKSWGGMLKELREYGSPAAVQQDWNTGRSSELAARASSNMTIASTPDEHAMHRHDSASTAATTMHASYGEIDRLIPIVQSLRLPAPVLIAPPSKAAPTWTARSETANRPERVNLVLDGETGAITQRTDFSQRPLLDRMIGIGVAAHEGQLFGWFNQALGLFTTAGLSLVSASAIVLWWRRRSPGTLGAPKTIPGTRVTAGIILIIAVLGLLLPLLGASMLLVLISEKLLLRHIEPARRFLGLDGGSV